MPIVIINSGVRDPDGRDEKLTEYLCDWPGCANVATDTLGCVKELGIGYAVCKEHKPERQERESHRG
jgi:hypothetical protein